MLLVLGRRVTLERRQRSASRPRASRTAGGTVAGVQGATITAPGVTTVAPIDRRAIDTVLRVGTYEKPMTSEDETSGLWKGAAKRVATQRPRMGECESGGAAPDERSTLERRRAGRFVNTAHN